MMVSKKYLSHLVFNFHLRKSVVFFCGRHLVLLLKVHFRHLLHWSVYRSYTTIKFKKEKKG